ncbi:hypothetical protein Y1Q_0012395 [Alligator mississippiensis]|uniref:Apolipoprotein L3-like n=1 Tax=Alligator mississippiensis TaxID=8496 RepID=A0A151MLB6_ALLMI|nr:hypothetical protein Y1Q_0012395 [Alligator mississippiensis]
MSSQETIVRSKEENQSKCYISKIDGKSCVPLNKDKERIAAAAKQSALEILSDALKKKDRVLMKTPRDLISCDSEDPKLWMKRFAVLTEQRNIQHEFERTLRHRGDYARGRYSCCGETARSSVCESAVPDAFLTCPNSGSKLLGRYIDVVVMERLLPARDRLKQHVAALRVIANTVDEVRRGATIADFARGSSSLGSTTATVGLGLAAMAFRTSLAVSLVGLAVSTAHSLIGTAATNTNVVQSRIEEEEMNGLLGQCQAEVQLIQERMKHIFMRVQEAAEDSASLSLLLPISQIRDRAGRTVLSTMKMVRAGELLDILLRYGKLDL